MSTSHLRIPVVTVASLVLGANAGACGGDDDDGTSQARQDAIVSKICNQAIVCFPEDENASAKLCEDSYAVSLGNAKRNLSQECFDLYLDYLDCYGDLSCEALENGDDACEELYTDLEERCDAFKPGDDQ